MRLCALLILVSIASVAKVKVEDFNEAMRESMDQVIKDNPEKYETRNPGRFPASVSPVEPERSDALKEEERIKMDSLQQRGVGLPKW